MLSPISSRTERNDEEILATDSDEPYPEKRRRSGATTTTTTTLDPPDGGIKAWAQVLCMHLVFFNTWGVCNGYGVFQQYYVQRFDVAPSTISWIGGAQVFFVFFIGVGSGRLTDAGHFKPVFAAGVFLQLLGLFMASLSTRYWQVLLSHAVCLGVGNGLAFCPALAVLSQYFKKKRAFSVGMASAGAAVGGLIYPVMIDRLINREDVGYPWAMRIMGFIMLATYMPCLVLMKPRLPPRTTGPWIDTSAFRESSFIFFSLCFFFCFWGLYFPFFYLGTYARDIIGVEDSANLVMILNGVGVFGRIIPPIIADRCTGILNLLVAFSLASGVLVYAWAAVSSSGGLIAFTVFNGLLASALQSLLPAAATTMTPDPSRTGTRIGMILCFVSFANLTGPAICGELIRRMGGSYLGAQMFAGSSILLATFMGAAARFAKTGFTLRVKA